MRKTITLSVPDFVYDFYNKVSHEMDNVSVEEVMERALFMYAGIISAEITRVDEDLSS